MSQTKVKSGLLNFPDQTDFVKLPSGTTAQRPVSPEQGYSRYNTTDNKLEFWDGTVWQQLGITPPSIVSILYPGDDLAADPAGGQTIIIYGTNFVAGATVTVGGDTAASVTFVSSNEISFVSTAKTSGDYDLIVTNPDNANATAVNGISYNGVPSWVTPAGSLGTFLAGSTIPTITLVATEPDSGLIGYSVTTGALPTGLTLSGADIDGIAPSPSGYTTYNFVMDAIDNENQSTSRNFNISVYVNTVAVHDVFGDGSSIATFQFNNSTVDLGGNYTCTSNFPYIAGIEGQALDGQENSSSYPNSKTLYAYSNIPYLRAGYSFSFWIYPGATNTAIYSHGNNGPNQAFRIGTINSNIYIARNASFDLRSAGSITSGQWNHVVITFNNGTNGFDIYINNSKETIAGLFNYGGSFSPVSFFCSYDSNYYGGSGYVGTSSGRLDQFRFFSKTLNESDVNALYLGK